MKDALLKDEVITGLEKGRKEGLFSGVDHTEMNGNSMLRHQAAISKQTGEGNFFTESITEEGICC